MEGVYAEVDKNREVKNKEKYTELMTMLLMYTQSKSEQNKIQE